MVYSDAIENRIFKRNKSLKPKHDKRGLYSDISFSLPELSFKERDSLKRLYLKEFNKIYYVTIDSVTYKSDFILGESTTKEFGFETYIDIKNLSKGRHLLKLQRDEFRKKDTVPVTFDAIPFWYFND